MSNVANTIVQPKLAVLSLALTLSVEDRRWLIEQATASLDTTPESSVLPAPTLTESDIDDLLSGKSRKTPAEILAWLKQNPSDEQWGGMRPDDDPVEYIRKLRRQTWADESDQI